jgi:hypothetical protein
MKSSTRLLLFATILLATIGLITVLYVPAHAQSAAAVSPVMPIGKPVQIEAPLGLPPDLATPAKTTSAAK